MGGLQVACHCPSALEWCSAQNYPVPPRLTTHPAPAQPPLGQPLGQLPAKDMHLIQ